MCHSPTYYHLVALHVCLVNFPGVSELNCYKDEYSCLRGKEKIIGLEKKKIERHRESGRERERGK